MKHLSCYCLGESHKSTDKRCQDCAYSEAKPELSMAIVCDGHGGERYFRSRVGAQIAVKVIKEAVREFVKTLSRSVYCLDGKPVFNGMPFTQYPKAKPYKTGSVPAKQAKMVHEALTFLISSIISQWNELITYHARSHPLNKWEKEHVEQRYRDEFIDSRNGDGTAVIEKNYGCTLMVYVQTPDFWFAFHLGDGKFLRFRMEDGKPVFDQPIPWDERCFLNKTTSISDSKALEETRYCYEGDGHFPEAVFLGSDGMDDSFGDGWYLTNFYIQLYKLIAKTGPKEAKKVLNESLPDISRRGSKDDMSVACVYDETRVKANALSLVEYQISEVEKERDEIAGKIKSLVEEVDRLKKRETLSESDKIDLHYKENDLAEASDSCNKLHFRKMRLCEEKKEIDINYEVYGHL